MTLLPPSAEQCERMNLELNHKPEQTTRDLILLKQWLSRQPHLPQHMEDERLERFLYGCKFSLERTKRILDTYYTVRATIPEFFSQRDPWRAEFQDSFKHMYYFPLPGLTTQGYRVTLLKLISYELDHFDLAVLVKRIVMTLDARLLEERNLNNVMVFDFQGFSAAHFARCSPTHSLARKAMLSIQDAFPMRLCQIHCVNVPPFIEKVIAIFSPLLKEKLMQKFLFHTAGGECLKEFMPQEILPSEYGGQAGSLNEINDAWKNKLVSLRNWFLEEDERSKTNESKRPLNKLYSNKNDYLCGGLHGSFRQLGLD